MRNFLHNKSLFLFVLLLLISHMLSLTAETYEADGRKPYFDLTFTGDIMAHTVNTNRTEFESVFSDISYIIENDDLTFANFESPVIDFMENKSYPQFNSHKEYPLTAANCGIDVFCLANNHVNDQYQTGIAETWNFFDSLYQEGIISGYSGITPDLDQSVLFHAENGIITKNTAVGTLSYCLIDKNGWKILYLAETEMLNDYYRMNRINYVPRTKKNLEAFPEVLAALREENPCDLFILGVHTDEPEYVRTVTDKRRKYFDSLLQAGVDIIWANHPHVTQEWDILTDEAGRPQKLILYSVGNLISGQRTIYGFDKPHHIYEWIGDSVIMEVSAVDTPDGIRFDGIFPVFATTHRKGAGDYIIKRYTTEFITTQNKLYSDYYSERFKDLSGIIPNIRPMEVLSENEL